MGLKMKKTVIFDLDGTLANIDVRRDKSLKPNGKLDWEIFAAPQLNFRFRTNLMHPVIKMAQMFHKLMGLRLSSLVVGTIESFVATKHWLTIQFDVPSRPISIKA